jgi:hypothetical protein
MIFLYQILTVVLWTIENAAPIQGSRALMCLVVILVVVRLAVLRVVAMLVVPSVVFPPVALMTLERPQGSATRIHTYHRILDQVKKGAHNWDKHDIFVSLCHRTDKNVPFHEQGCYNKDIFFP